MLWHHPVQPALLIDGLHLLRSGVNLPSFTSFFVELPIYWAGGAGRNRAHVVHPLWKQRPQVGWAVWGILVSGPVRLSPYTHFKITAVQSEFSLCIVFFILLLNVKKTFLFTCGNPRFYASEHAVISQNRKSQHSCFNYAPQCLTLAHRPEFTINLTLSLTSPLSHRLSISTFTDAVFFFFNGLAAESNKVAHLRIAVWLHWSSSARVCIIKSLPCSFHGKPAARKIGRVANIYRWQPGVPVLLICVIKCNNWKWKKQWPN